MRICWFSSSNDTLLDMSCHTAFHPLNQPPAPSPPDIHMSPKLTQHNSSPSPTHTSPNPPPIDLIKLTLQQLSDPQTSLQTLPHLHTSYLLEARRLQLQYAPQIHILIAFEAEFIRPSYTSHVLSLFTSSPLIDYFIGSVHHVHGIPIDYDRPTYAAAVAATSNGSEEQLFEDYYDLQYDMLKALKPRIVGHFDLIRLMSEDPARDPRLWPAVWEKICRNLEYAASIGAWLECNTAALRKGLDEPYPGRIISEVNQLTTLRSFTPSKLQLFSYKEGGLIWVFFFYCRNGSSLAENSQCQTTATASHKSPRITPAA